MKLKRYRWKTKSDGITRESDIREDSKEFRRSSIHGDFSYEYLRICSEINICEIERGGVD